jgi:hypothetical protein
MLKKRIWANFQRILEVFTQNIFTKLSKIWVRDPDPRSGIRDPEKTYSGSRIQGSKRQKSVGSAYFGKFHFSSGEHGWQKF